ncbi:MAG: NAD(P)/FAD-dependent oxidoreductase [Bacteroidetes bacterium]|nr:NAD(P)/FAD-dependent oxidoreductase [Bacteroidota bacterium]
MTFDVAIIGGGIAGLALAVDIKSRGYNVVVIEKGNYPRHKVCGEYISMESHNYLEKICPALKKLNLPWITDFKITTGKTKEFNTALGLGGFGISRYLLEELLFEEAKIKGVIFLLETKAKDIHYENDLYTIETNSGNVFSKLVCNSSGRKSNLEAKERSEQLKGTNYVGIKYHIKIKRDPRLIEIHNFPGGYCGISNIEEDKVCLCYIVNSKKLKEANNSIPELEKNTLHKNSQLKKIFNDAVFIFKEPLTISGINFRIKKPVKDGSFFLGDSAGSIAPITGNGMSIGLRSASILGVLVDEFFLRKISRMQLEKKYDDFWNKEFSARIKLSRHFQKLSEYSFLTGITINLFNNFPSIAKTIIKLTHGKPF